MTRGTKILWVMIACAVVALGFGFMVMRNRISNPLPQQQADSNQTQQSTTETTQNPSPEPPPVAAVSTEGWKTYTNDKHGFMIDYPTDLKAGSISDNSILGTFDTPVRGYHVGPLVLVVLKDAGLKKDAQDMFQSMYTTAINPPAATAEGDIPPVECKIILDTTDKKAVSCNGEGGAARYAYISGSFDVLVDGYTKGYDSQDNGNLKDDSEFVGIVNSFAYGTTKASDANTTSTTTASVPASTNPSVPAAPAPTPGFQAFTITADDNGATPNQITVAKDAIVQITFAISSNNVYYGGLDFRSSIVNSGTIHSGESKTISFKATESFQFTPYWPASSVAKDYKITVTVQ